MSEQTEPGSRSASRPASRPGAERGRRWLALGGLPVAAAALVALNALYVLLVAFGNITDFGTNQAFVQHVMSMDTTNFGAPAGTDLDSSVMWRAITATAVQNVAYVALIAWETITGVILAVALVFWVRERGRGYRVARALSSIGLLMIVMLFMGGFIAIGGEWFQMWRSTAWNGEDAALRNAVLALVSLVVLHLPSTRWAPRAAGGAI
ncbi:DUF2165 domain-containing protein [Microbacterium ulmi]|uniref:DUF2165 domain-containing protein n=1 Tax=Microbacterium ulmi TaxID=179095 RepID=A0A7Y2Q2M6_9MICO|nr:DUF2165 domain-containing protein [Microbacterium ulmi]NII68613.1 putative small integral membrane protein [Microbacterium ulmi]NNH04783.1 DUF2165 domain-containing protein [Microbacterium ulmi]